MDSAILVRALQVLGGVLLVGARNGDRVGVVFTVMLLTASLVTVLGAVAGAHGWMI